jgi:predicted lipase
MLKKKSLTVFSLQHAPQWPATSVAVDTCTKPTQCLKKLSSITHTGDSHKSFLHDPEAHKSHWPSDANNTTTHAALQQIAAVL